MPSRVLVDLPEPEPPDALRISSCRMVPLKNVEASDPAEPCVLSQWQAIFRCSILTASEARSGLRASMHCVLCRRLRLAGSPIIGVWSGAEVPLMGEPVAEA